MFSQLQLRNAKYIIAYFDLFIGLLVTIDRSMMAFKQKMDYDEEVRRKVHQYNIGTLNKEYQKFQPTWQQIQQLKAASHHVLIEALEGKLSKDETSGSYKII